MSITPTLHWTFHHRLLCLFSAAFPIWFCGALHRNIGIKRLSRCTIQGRRIPISFISPPDYRRILYTRKYIFILAQLGKALFPFNEVTSRLSCIF